MWKTTKDVKGFVALVADQLIAGWSQADEFECDYVSSKRPSVTGRIQLQSVSSPCLGARTLLGASGLTRNKKLLGTKGIALEARTLLGLKTVSAKIKERKSQRGLQPNILQRQR